jgi:1,2-diacylglycerol 3-beta-glucosyltransferase
MSFVTDLILNILAVPATAVSFYLLTLTLLLSVFCVISLVMYVLRGWRLRGVGLRGIVDLARAPSFVLGKVLLMLRKRGPAWIRIEREPS